MVHDIYTSFLAPFLPLIMAKLGISVMLAGSLSLYMRLPSAFSPLLGVASDRVELKPWFCLSPAVSAAAMCALGLAPSYAIMALILVTAGTSAAIFHVVGPVIVTRVAANRVGRGMGWFMTAGELARTLGPVTAVAAVSWLGFEGLMPIVIVAVAATVMLFIQLRGVGSVSAEQSAPLGQAWRVMRPVIVPVGAILLFRAFVTQSFMLYLPTYMVEQGRSLWFGGASLAVLELAGVVGTLIAGGLSDRIGRRSVLVTVTLTSPVLMLAFLYGPGWSLFPVLVLQGVSLFAGTPVMLALVQEYSHGHRGAANGLFMGLGFGLGAVAVFVIGWMVDVIGFEMAFTISGLISLAGLPAAILLPKGRPGD